MINKNTFDFRKRYSKKLTNVKVYNLNKQNIWFTSLFIT